MQQGQNKFLKAKCKRYESRSYSIQRINTNKEGLTLVNIELINGKDAYALKW
jgi:hypothetical protein